MLNIDTLDVRSTGIPPTFIPTGYGNMSKKQTNVALIKATDSERDCDCNCDCDCTNCEKYGDCECECTTDCDED